MSRLYRSITPNKAFHLDSSGQITIKLPNAFVIDPINNIC